MVAEMRELRSILISAFLRLSAFAFGLVKSAIALVEAGD